MSRSIVVATVTAAVVLVAGVLAIAFGVAAGDISWGDAVVPLSSVALVAVTIVYVAITSNIAKANAETVAGTKRLADETTTLARETSKMAEAAVGQAKATADTLSHLQSPVLVLWVYAKPDEHKVPIQVQNVGEGAAILPAVYTAEDTGLKHNLLSPEGLHIYPPRQFDEEDPVVKHQRFDLPRPASNDFFLIVRCQDPRTGGALLHRKWHVWMRDPTAWFAEPVTEVEELDGK